MTRMLIASGLILSAVLAACSSVPKAASTGATALPSVAARVTAARKQGMVCDDDSLTGSHLTQRLCLSPEEAEERHKASQGAAFDIQHSAVPRASSAPVPP